VPVPTPQQEQQRSVVRYREQLLRDRRRAEARGRALLLTQAVLAPRGWWRPTLWPDFSREIPQWSLPQVKYWQGRALAADAKEREVRLELQKMLNIALPVGVGALSWIVLEQELRGWERFHNRRQIASYTGLCPGVHSRDSRACEGSINRCGNSVVRYTFIEMAWRFLRWQPQYPPIQKLRKGLFLSRRARRRLIVAAARRLAIDLWRWATARASAQELGLVLEQRLNNHPAAKAAGTNRILFWERRVYAMRAGLVARSLDCTARSRLFHLDKSLCSES